MRLGLFTSLMAQALPVDRSLPRYTMAKDPAGEERHGVREVTRGPLGSMWGIGTFAQLAVARAGDFVRVVDGQLLAVLHHRVDPFVPLQDGRGVKHLLDSVDLQNKSGPCVQLFLAEILDCGSKHSAWTSLAAGC